MAQRVAFGLLLVDDQKFWHLTLIRISRAYEWHQHLDEWQLAHTRMMAFYMGNHKADSPKDMFMLPSEWKKRVKDIEEGRVPIATFRKLTPEEIKNWK